MSMHTPHGGEDPACAVAHGTGSTLQSLQPLQSPQAADGAAGERTLVAVFASPVAGYLLRFGADLGFRGLLLEPDEALAAGAAVGGFPIVGAVKDDLDSADVVVTDHHRAELGPVLRDVLATRARWIGLMGNPRHVGPHVEALAALGVPQADIARVHRPVGLNIGSHTPPEIAISALAGLVADRNGRPGGFGF